jgi:hypothetical protein
LNQARVALAQFIHAKAEPLNGSWGEIVEKHIGPGE